MVKYKIKKLWPTADTELVGEGDVVHESKLLSWGINNPEAWPEFFVKVKQHLLETEDGYKIYSKESKLYFIGFDWKVHDGPYYIVNTFMKTFFEKQNAEKYIKQILDNFTANKLNENK